MDVNNDNVDNLLINLKTFINFLADKNYDLVAKEATEGDSVVDIANMREELDIFTSKNHFFDNGGFLQFNNSANPLNILCDKYGTDKGEFNAVSNPYHWVSHNYGDLYDLLFRSSRQNIKKILECGIGTNDEKIPNSMGKNGLPGASLRVWRDYFPNAEVFGVDIDDKILFEENRIKTFKCDQVKKESIINFILESGLQKESLDIVIDDGLHTFEAGKSFFEGTIHLLKPDGIYIIEDVAPSGMLEFKKYFSRYVDNYTIFFFSLDRMNTKIKDNRLLCIRKTYL